MDVKENQSYELAVDIILSEFFFSLSLSPRPPLSQMWDKLIRWDNLNGGTTLMVGQN